MKPGLVDRIATFDAKVERQHRFLAMKLAFSAVAIAVLVAQFSQTLTTRLRDVSAATVLPARIRAARLFSISAEVPGAVAAVAVIAGDKIEPGQELAVLDSPEISLALERAKNRLARARQRIDSHLGDDRRMKIYLEQYSAAEAAWKVACERANQVDTGPQERMYDQYSTRLKAIEKLAVENLATSAELERSRREEQGALLNLKGGREHQSRLRQECDACLAQVRVAKLQVDLHRTAETDSIRAEYDEASAQVTMLEQQERRLRVVALHRGTVLSVMIAPGERIGAGTVLFQMGDVRELSVEVPVDAEIARDVTKGDPVTVRLPTHPPKEIEAAVSSVVLAPGEDARSYVVRVLIPNPDTRTILAGLEGAVAFRHTSGGGVWAKLPF
jgi:multidrug resistance efflux pump